MTPKTGFIQPTEYALEEQRNSQDARTVSCGSTPHQVADIQSSYITIRALKDALDSVSLEAAGTVHMQCVYSISNT